LGAAVDRSKLMVIPASRFNEGLDMRSTESRCRSESMAMGSLR
jgi:hypothetical protein